MNATAHGNLTRTAGLAFLLLVFAALFAPPADAAGPEATAAGVQYRQSADSTSPAEETEPSLQIPLGEEVTPDEAVPEPAGPTSQVAGAETPTGGGGGGERRLPFTGYLAIPALLLGLGLLTVGVALRRRTALQV